MSEFNRKMLCLLTDAKNELDTARLQMMYPVRHTPPSEAESKSDQTMFEKIMERYDQVQT